MLRSLSTVFLLMLVLPAPARAEVKLIDAEASYALGDSDSKVTARRIALQEAQRRALEAAGTYISSLTEVRDFQLTADEVRAYTAGIVETEIIEETMQGTADRPSLAVKVRCRIDTDVLVRQIEEFRGSEELKQQLLAAQQENEALARERDALLARLGSSPEPSAQEEAKHRLDEVLTREETTREVARLWMVFSGSLDPVAPAAAARPFTDQELDDAAAALERADRIAPRNVRTKVLLATVYELKGDPEQAERLLRDAIKVHPANPAYHLALGLFLDRQNRKREALRQFLAYERLRPREAKVLFHIGMAYRDLDQCRQASSNLKRFLKATEKDRTRRTAAMRKKALATLNGCKGMPRGPEGRQQPLRRPR